MPDEGDLLEFSAGKLKIPPHLVKPAALLSAVAGWVRAGDEICVGSGMEIGGFDDSGHKTTAKPYPPVLSPLSEISSLFHSDRT